MDVKIEQSWKEALAGEFEKPYFAELARLLHREKAEGKVIFPPGPEIFKAFELTPVDKVKVVILGQDPYHGYGQAMGLSFSVPDNVPAPPSLKNIFKEIESDLGIRMSGRPNLESWARQGVLLLNAILTVRSGEAASHSGIGWQQFTDAVIRYLSENRSGIVFMLWGSFAVTGMLVKSYGDWYLLSNEKNLDGSNPHDMRGYEYGWYVSDKDLKDQDVVLKTELLSSVVSESEKEDTFVRIAKALERIAVALEK